MDFIPWRRLGLIIILICSVQHINAQSYTYTPPPNTPLANHEHPRMFFTLNDLQEISTYINNYETVDFQTFINGIDALYNQIPSSKDRNDLLFDGINFAFLSIAVHSGYFNNFYFGFTAEQYAVKAISHASDIGMRIANDEIHESHHASSFTSPDNGGYIQITLGVIYDWCFDYLNLAQKQFIADIFIDLYHNRDKDVNPHKRNKLDNIFSRYHVGSVGATAFWGDNLGSTYDIMGQEMLNTIQWIVYDRVVLMGEHAFEQNTGWSEGMIYYAEGQTGVCFLLTAIESAIDEDFFNKYKWLHNTILYLYFALFPSSVDGDFYFQRNDQVDLRSWEYSKTIMQFQSTMAKIKDVDPNLAGFGKWLINDSEYRFKEVSFENLDLNLYWLFYKFIWGSKDVQPVNPTQFDIAKSYRFGLGDVIIKSDLLTQNSTKINFYSPTWYVSSHHHDDVASFAIWKYGTLAIDAGCAKSGKDLPKSEATGTPIYHNIMAFYRPGVSTVYEYDKGADGDADAYYDPEYQLGGANHVGDVVAMKFEDEIFEYVDFDYIRSYKEENYVNKLRRKFLYIRDPNAPNYSDNEYVVIFDDVDLTDVDIKRRWLLHTPFQIDLEDASWGQQGAGFWTSETGTLLKTENTYAESHGKLFLKILAPTDHRLILRGGDGHWFTDAEGNDLTKRGPFEDWGAFWVGTYRLEIEDQTNNNASQYLTVMQIGDANTLNSMVPVVKLNSGSFIGTFINEDRVAFFNKNTVPEQSVSYSIISNKTVKHIIGGLAPGTYNIKLNGNTISGINSLVDDSGVLYFEAPGGGNFNISLLPTGVLPESLPAQGFYLQQNYPNPFNPSTSIAYQLPMDTNVELKIFDLQGRPIRTLINTFQNSGSYSIAWEGENDEGQLVGTGLYLYQLKTVDATESRKMLLVK
jgi:hypothetical protein